MLQNRTDDRYYAYRAAWLTAKTAQVAHLGSGAEPAADMEAAADESSDEGEDSKSDASQLRLNEPESNSSGAVSLSYSLPLIEQSRNARRTHVQDRLPRTTQCVLLSTT